MAAPFQTTRRVEFRDTDAAGIMHFSSFFTFMEEAEHELLRSLGLSVVMREGDETVSWPRVSASFDFSGAARFEDVLTLEVGIDRLGERSVTYRCRVLRGGEEIASGKMTTVCCVIEPGRPPKSTPIPPVFREKLAAFA